MLVGGSLARIESTWPFIGEGYADLLIKQKLIPRNLSTAVVSESIWKTGSRELELSPSSDADWHNVWSQFKAGG